MTGEIVHLAACAVILKFFTRATGLTGFLKELAEESHSRMGPIFVVIYFISVVFGDPSQGPEHTLYTELYPQPYALL
jgi:hypothetical protein